MKSIFLTLLVGVLGLIVSNAKSYAEPSREWPVIMIELYQQERLAGKEYLKSAFIELSANLTDKDMECSIEAGEYLYAVTFYFAEGYFLYSAIQVIKTTPDQTIFYIPRFFGGALSLPINIKVNKLRFASIRAVEPFVWKLDITAFTKGREADLWKHFAVEDGNLVDCKIRKQ